MAEQSPSWEIIKERFLSVNRDRLQRTMALMSAKQPMLLELLPMLFHVNHRALPGFVDEDTPSAVFDYVPDEKVIKYAEKNWVGFEIEKRGVWKYDIDAIFLMGSCGTVAFNRKSDFDVWLCHAPELSKDALKRLQKKASLIEKWYEKNGLEVHFFLMDAEAFKQGRVKKLSSESSGTAQHHLLLDEFYRTSLWLAGKVPLWWYVPPALERKYDKIKQDVENNNQDLAKQIIDFGPLADIPTSEFFGAAVWQIYKGIDSPYKSVLKITLMESYAASYPDNTPLSAEFKQKIFDDNVDPHELDPYLSMLRRIESYLMNQNDTGRLEVIRRSFYLKLDLPLSVVTEKENWRYEWIWGLVENWGWSVYQFAHLDNQAKWQLEDVLEERKLLILHLTKSYAFLSNFARENARKRLINQKDLSILGRKLYSVFDRKAGKIEIFNRGIVDTLREESITIMLLHGKDQRDHWRFFRGRVVGEKFKSEKPLKQAYSLIEVVAWAYFNRIIGETTQRLLYAPRSELGNNELNILLDIFNKMNDGKNILVPDNKNLLRNSYIEKSLVFLNIGRQPALGSGKLDRQIAGGDIDAFNFGSNTECLIQTIEYCYITSWKEVFVFKYYGADGLAGWLCELLDGVQVTSRQGDIPAPIPEVHSLGSNLSYILSTRFARLAKAVVENFVSDPEKCRSFIFEAAHHFYWISYEEDKFQFEKIASQGQIIDRLSTPSSHFKTVTFDEYTFQASTLSCIYSKNRKDLVQIFYLNSPDGVFIHVLDENGVLYIQKLPTDKPMNIVKQFVRFFEAVLERKILMQQQFVDTESIEDIEDYAIEVYKLFKEDLRYHCQLQPLPDTRAAASYGVQVIGDVVDGKNVFTFYCDDAEFSSSDHGSNIFQAVANHIVERRESEGRYYVYITDMELAPAVVGKKASHVVETAELLKYKKKIEDSLNRAISFA